MNMVERVAMAIDGHISDVPTQADILKAARAAIEVMREPSKEMAGALTDLLDYPGTDRTVEQMWSGLIDAALQS